MRDEMEDAMPAAGWLLPFIGQGEAAYKHVA
jgi:hypothetical protein